MKALTIFSGILMVASGVFCFANSGKTFLAMAFIVGAVMVLNGFIHFMAYLVGRGLHNKGDNNGWIAIEALMTLALGILVMANQLVIDTAVPLVFGMWAFVTGLLRIEAASRINVEKKSKNFKVTLITGIITILVGLFCFVNPLMSWVSVVVLLGICMLVIGIDDIELGINMPHQKRDYIRVYRRSHKPIVITNEEETEEKVAERLETIKEQELQAEEQAEIMETMGVKLDENL